jgi:hypothetical protein
MRDGSLIKKFRSIGLAAALLMAPAAIAQNKETSDHVQRIVARSEAKHLRSRQNLLKILRERPQFWPELQAVAERLKTQPAWLLNKTRTHSTIYCTLWVHPYYRFRTQS